MSVNIIDQCVAQGVPFAREYGGLLDNRSFGGAQVCRTFYARGQTGQQLLLGAYQALARQVHLGNVELLRAHRDARPRREGRPRGRRRRPRPDHRRRSRRSRRTRSCSAPVATATSSSSRRTPRRSNVTAIWRAHRRGALMANPCFTQIHPTCIPASDDFQSKLTLMSESLRNDGRVWVPGEGRRPALARPDPGSRARLLPRAPLPRVRQPRPARRRVARDQARGRRRPRRRSAEERRVPRPRRRDPPARQGRHRGALRQPHPDVRAHHRRGPVPGPDAHLPGDPLHDGRALGRLQPDEQHPRAVRARRGELLGPRREPARRERADAGPRRRLLRAAGDDRRRARAAARHRPGPDRRPRVPRGRGRGRRARCSACSSVNGKRSVDYFHRELGKVMWDNCGMARSAESLDKALGEIPALREEFWSDVRVLGENETFNQSLEKAGPRRRLPRVRRAARARRAATARRAAAATSGSSTRPRRARRSATTTTSRTSPRGSGRARTSRRSCTRSRSSSRTSRSRSAATSDRGDATRGSEPQGVATGRARRHRPVRDLRDARRERRHVVPRAVRRPQRAAQRARARSRSPSTTTAARASAGRAP